MRGCTNSSRATPNVEGEGAVAIDVSEIAADGQAPWTASSTDDDSFNATKRLIVGQTYTPDCIERGELS